MKTPSSLIVVLVLLALSCTTPEYLTPEELNKFISDADNGLIQKNEVNGYVLEVAYKPTDLWVHQEIEGESVDAKKIKSFRSKYDPYYYFILNLSKNNNEALQVDGNFGQYSELVQTLSFRMNDYVNLTTAAQDTIPTADAILNRTFGLSEATSVLFVFSKEKAKGKEWVQFNLNEFGMGVGNQRFRFKVKDLEQVPHINFDLTGSLDKNN
jgi:hypothetical protein